MQFHVSLRDLFLLLILCGCPAPRPPCRAASRWLGPGLQHLQRLQSGVAAPFLDWSSGMTLFRHHLSGGNLDRHTLTGGRLGLESLSDNAPPVHFPGKLQPSSPRPQSGLLLLLVQRTDSLQWLLVLCRKFRSNPPISQGFGVHSCPPRLIPVSAMAGLDSSMWT